ncbi:NAC domain-containing protein [Quillaja saponaria]|uniref:NAC domain-containing protein n=1 Tax=Quillaja saponaria TaxID=32244 RepID=A0AAD7PDC1_QUISA|nr:NAC domain-containing protein [Quillaja saponaria]
MQSTTSMLEDWPVGLRFKPTDEELITHYLKHKLLGNDSKVWAIPEVDILKWEPSDLPDKSVLKSDDPEWFFFSPPELKYKKSKRSNRTTRAGYWKATGTDRKIRTRGTNNVIGIKKTLVFYEGRVPNGINTNWVIHEYHPVNILPHQRAFVICRLMKKPEKPTEKGTDISTYDGEPSSCAASDYENQGIENTNHEVCGTSEKFPELLFSSLSAEDYDLDSLLQSPVHEELGPAFPDVLYANGFTDECNSFQILSKAKEQELDPTDEFVNSFLVEQGSYSSKETMHPLVNGYPTPKSLRKVYHEDGGISSDTDNEAIFARHASNLEISSIFNEYIGSTESRQMQMVTSSEFTSHADAQVSLNLRRGREKKKSIFHDNLWALDTSSGDSAADTHFEINCLEFASEESPVSVPTAYTQFGINYNQIAREESPVIVRNSKAQYHPGPANYSSKRAITRRIQTQKRECRVESQDEAQKEMSIVASIKGQGKAEGTIPRKNLRPMFNRSPGISWKNFISMETPLLSQNSSPQLVYLVNAVIGLFLFIAVILEVISYRKCY